MTNDDGEEGGGNAFILLLVFVKERNGITYALCSLIISVKGFAFDTPSLLRLFGPFFG